MFVKSNPTSKSKVILALFCSVLLFMTACSAASESAETEVDAETETETEVDADAETETDADADAGTEVDAETETETEVDADAETEVAAPSLAAPELVAGEVTTGSVEISGTVVEYALTTPDGFSIGDEAPLVLAFPPGPQELALAEDVVANTWASEAQRLGWVVISPAAPEGVLYFEGSEVFVPGLLDWVETWMSPEGGLPHVVGISNGGASAFRYGVQNSERLHSLIVLPGAPIAEDQSELVNLAEVPIRMYVGGDDTDDAEQAQQTLEILEQLGADVELTVFEGEGHVMESTSDGVIVFEQLESFR